MSVDRSGPEPGEQRFPCPWCHLSQAWPDECTETPGTGSGCASMIQDQCMLGDHRRCAIGACTSSTRWHQEVSDAGIIAAHAAGQAWAIVSTIPNEVIVVGTAEDREQAEQAWRTVVRHTGRDPEDPENRGLVYIVRASDGALL